MDYNFKSDHGTPAEAVAHAAAFLDGHRPKWYRNVDTDRLAVESSSDCLLAQVFGGYWRGQGMIGTREFFSVKEDGETTFYSFASPEATVFWLAEIHARRAADSDARNKRRPPVRTGVVQDAGTASMAALHLL